MDSSLWFSFRDLAGKVGLEGITSRRAGEGKGYRPGEFRSRKRPAVIPSSGISAGDKPLLSEYG